ncbi:hypothetical protein LT85_1196 [Collimonas arenae]|uniref:Uncharacterized protein n=1 Tax=Collimonas arenae TaxID=279058 RepID=A0A0A1F9M1_9BURK|nr:hypothetical protein LT85_1196 [Collimonas arenae]
MQPWRFTNAGRSTRSCSAFLAIRRGFDMVWGRFQWISRKCNMVKLRFDYS